MIKIWNLSVEYLVDSSQIKVRFFIYCADLNKFCEKGRIKAEKYEDEYFELFM